MSKLHIPREELAKHVKAFSGVVKHLKEFEAKFKEELEAKLKGKR